MANVIENEITALVDKELDAANEKFGLNHSNHESYAVLHEEMEEAQEAMTLVKYHETCIWDATKKNAAPPTIRELYAKEYRAAVSLAVEAVQVAAMARKAIVSNIEFTEIKKGGQDHGGNRI